MMTFTINNLNLERSYIALDSKHNQGFALARADKTGINRMLS